MSDFFLKKFELVGLNCTLSNVSIGKFKSNVLSNVLRRLSRTDERFQIATRDVLIQPTPLLPTASRFSRRWLGVSGQNQISKGISKDHLEFDSKNPEMQFNDRLSIYSHFRITTRLIQTIRWEDSSDSLNLISFLSDIESPDELSTCSDEFCLNDFRYAISDREGKLVSTGFDSEQPIFSGQGPRVESGFSVEISLVSKHHVKQRVPILARASVMNADTDCENDYELGFCF